MSGMRRDIEMIQERDITVRMRDGVHLSVDVYRPAGRRDWNRSRRLNRRRRRAAGGAGLESTAGGSYAALSGAIGI